MRLRAARRGAMLGGMLATFTPWSSLCGGAMIGAAAVLVLALNGRIAGISGMCAVLVQRERGDMAWRALFLVGLVLGYVIVAALAGGLPFTMPRALWVVAVAGVLVGLGTRVGGGCTSGHGVCGVGRGSVRSIVATVTFMLFGAITVYVVGRVAGGAA